MGVAVTRFDVHLVHLDPAMGRGIKKTRPCVVVSPDEINRNLSTVIVAPMTTRRRDYPSRVPCKFRGKAAEVVLDQIRTVDRARLVRKLGHLEQRTAARVLAVLGEMFAP